jgi:hypothetical protein
VAPATFSARQRQARERMEALIALAAPALDLMLGAGERLSRIVGGEDYDYYPIRAPGESLELPPVGRSSAGSGREPA